MRQGLRQRNGNIPIFNGGACWKENPVLEGWRI